MRLAVAGNVVDFGARRLLDVDESLRRVLEADLAIDDVDALRDELAAFVQCLRDGSAPKVSGHDGLRAMEAAEMVRRAAGLV